MKRTCSTAVVSLVAGALLSAGVLAGCGGGGGGVPDERPDDFSLRFQWVAGSVPAPYHDEWKLEVGSDGGGTVDYTPDYAGDRVPIYHETFEVSPADLNELWEALRSNDLLREEYAGSDDDEPVGGSVRSAEIVAGGKTYEVPPFASGDAVISDATVEQIRRIVPANVWKSLQDRRERYAMQRYGEKP